MTMTLYTPGGSSGLLNRLAALFRAAEGLEPLVSGDGLAAAGMGTEAAALRAAVRYCEEQRRITPAPADALRIIIDECRAAGYYFPAGAQTVSIAADAGNLSDAAIVWIARNAAGQRVLIYPELLRLAASAAGVAIEGQRRRERTAGDWPGGSGIKLSRAAADISQSLVRNPDFETLDGDRPAEWLIRTGAWGATVSLTQPEEQQIAISGAPTGGYWCLTWTDPLGRGYDTPPLPHNATAAQVQAALRTIPLWRAAAVSGANPFVVNCENTPGNIAALSAVHQLSGGTNPSVAVSTLVDGDALSYRGRSLKLTGVSGGEQTCLWQQIRLEAGAVYAVALRARRTASATGTLRLELRRCIDGATTADPAGGLNRIERTIDTISAAGHTTITGSFVVGEADASRPLSLAIHLSNPLPNGQSLALDELYVGRASRLYEGGPYLAIVAGWKPLIGDRWTIDIVDASISAWERCCDRWLRLRELADIALPDSGGTLIPDSLITG